MATLEAPARVSSRLPQGEFRNEPLSDFSRDEAAARAMRAAIEKVRAKLGREYDLVIGGRRQRTSGKIKSINPARPSQVVGVHQKAGAEHAGPAVEDRKSTRLNSSH